MRTLLLLLLSTTMLFGQNATPKEFTFAEFLGYVKKYHPLVKSANLEISQAQANLMMARGAFDPKIEIDFDKKQFKDKEYYSLLNSSFKIPTWYGIELKAGFDNNEGVYINPENTVPSTGLTSIGINVPLGQGLFINQRMADIRKAKLQIQLSQSERKIQTTAVLYDAALAYFTWKKNYSEVQLYEQYLSNAKTRNIGIASLIKNGDKPAIDSIEAGIIFKNRQLSLEDALLKLTKSKLELSTYLWLDNNVPIELQDTLIPEENLKESIKELLKTEELLATNNSITNHPKIKALENKINILTVDRKLKANQLLPKIDLGYSLLSEPTDLNQSNTKNYKIGLNFYFPLFLRKERGSLQLAKFKIQDTNFELELEKIQLTNKIKAQRTEIKSLENQMQLSSELVNDYNLMLTSEERLFSFGESSIFLLNTRENNLVSAQLSNIALENRYYNSNAALFKIMANPD
jgi:outer membrane protein TolC